MNVKPIDISKIKIEKLRYLGFYPVRTSNKISELKKWNKWADKYYGKEKKFLFDELGHKLKDKTMLESMSTKDYWKMKIKAGLEHRYSIWSKL